MNQPPIAAADYAALRERATSQLRGGKASPADASRALQVLFDLASVPATAAQALALLHELQVHQVEVDLQDEELRSVRTEMELALARHVQLYESAPAAHLAIDADTTLREANRTAERMFGYPRELLLGRSLQSLVAASSLAVLTGMLARVAEGTGAATHGELLLSDNGGATRTLHAGISPDPGGTGFLVALLEASQDNA